MKIENYEIKSYEDFFNYLDLKREQYKKENLIPTLDLLIEDLKQDDDGDNQRYEEEKEKDDRETYERENTNDL